MCDDCDFRIIQHFLQIIRQNAAGKVTVAWAGQVSDDSFFQPKCAASMSGGTVPVIEQQTGYSRANSAQADDRYFRFIHLNSCLVVEFRSVYLQTSGSNPSTRNQPKGACSGITALKAKLEMRLCVNCN
ncbi:MAG: hypothetical protein Aurels2KO_43450 [Aureliella sp.]